MFRLVRLLVFVLVGIVAVARIAAEFGFTVEWGWFGVGLLIAAIVGFLDMQISNWWSTVTQPYKPQMVKMPTKETPAQITGAATKARLGSGVLLAGLAAAPIIWINSSVTGMPLVEVLLAVLPAAFLVGFIVPIFVAKKSVG